MSRRSEAVIVMIRTGPVPERIASAGMADVRARTTPPAGPVGVDDARRARIEQSIERHSGACGCEVGSLFTVAAMLSFLAYLGLGDPGWSAGGALWWGAAWILTWSTVGKLVGLVYARVRLHMLRSQLSGA
jgi:hypothetical protein